MTVWVENSYSNQNFLKSIGVRAGGRRGLQPLLPPATEITWFFGRNAHDLGNDTWEDTLQNNAVGRLTALGETKPNESMLKKKFTLLDLWGNLSSDLIYCKKKENGMRLWVLHKRHYYFLAEGECVTLSISGHMFQPFVTDYCPFWTTSYSSAGKSVSQIGQKIIIHHVRQL